MSSPTVLLIAPPVLFGTTWWRKHIASKPHLRSLAGYVRDIAEVRIVDLDMAIDPSADEARDEARVTAALVEHLSLEDVDLVGISCWTSLHYLGSVAVAKAVRQLAPNVPIAVGGHHATALPSDFVTADELFDVVVRGDGEHVLRALCEEVPARSEPSRVVTGRPFAMADPAHIDWPTYAADLGPGRELWLGLSRGCPFQCHYCAEPQGGIRWNRYEVADALVIVDELVKVAQPRVICFSDPLFGASRRWSQAFLEGLHERALPTLFWAETRADLMTPRLLELFRDCRFKIDFGVDTGSERMAELMLKSNNPASYLDKTRATLQLANSLEVPHGMFLIFNYPGETPETVAETAEYAESIAPTGPTSGDLAGQAFFILPGTEVFHRMDAYGQAHGTQIRHPHWWRERADHHALATDILPSDTYRGREDELTAFLPWQWSLNMRWAMRHTPEVQAFRQAFHSAEQVDGADADYRTG